MTRPNLSEAYESSVPQRRIRRLESLAKSYRPNPNLEKLIALRAEDPATFKQLMTPTRRLELAVYEDCKAAHEQWKKEATNG